MMITTFLLLRPLSASRPPITSTELPAGSAFNVALRTMASRDGFESQWFGWQHATGAGTESNSGTEKFVWVINWQDVATAQALMSPGKLRATLGKLTQYFDIPDATPNELYIDDDKGMPQVLTIRWTSDNALKLLNWTNRILLLHFQPPLDSLGKTQQHADEMPESEWTARGRAILPGGANDDQTSAVVTMRSVSAQYDEVEVHQDWQPFSALRPTLKIPEDSNSAIAVSLTRTRWCTKIREGLMDTIKSRRQE